MKGNVTSARMRELMETYEVAELERDVRDDLIDCMAKGMCEMGRIVEALNVALESK